MSTGVAGRPFDAVLCDLDNVVRFYDMSRVAELERELGLAEGTAAGVAYAPERDLPLLLGRVSYEEWTDAVERGLGEWVSDGRRARELAVAFAEAPSWVDQVVVELLWRVRGRARVVLVTNATVRLEKELAALGLADLAHEVVSSAREGVAKPDRRIYRLAAERAGVPEERCLFVDDRLENVEAAVACGMRGVHYRQAEDLRGALAGMWEGR
nr:HAD-IA family hydrolase [Streptomyces alkaliterrae]